MSNPASTDNTSTNTDPSEPRWACDRNPNHSNPAPATECGIPMCGTPRTN